MWGYVFNIKCLPWYIDVNVPVNYYTNGLHYDWRYCIEHDCRYPVIVQPGQTSPETPGQYSSVVIWQNWNKLPIVVMNLDLSLSHLFSAGWWREQARAQSSRCPEAWCTWSCRRAPWYPSSQPWRGWSGWREGHFPSCRAASEAVWSDTWAVAFLRQTGGCLGPRGRARNMSNDFDGLLVIVYLWQSAAWYHRISYVSICSPGFFAEHVFNLGPCWGGYGPDWGIVSKKGPHLSPEILEVWVDDEKTNICN